MDGYLSSLRPPTHQWQNLAWRFRDCLAEIEARVYSETPTPCDLIGVEMSQHEQVKKALDGVNITGTYTKQRQ